MRIELILSRSQHDVQATTLRAPLIGVGSRIRTDGFPVLQTSALPLCYLAVLESGRRVGGGPLPVNRRGAGEFPRWPRLHARR